MTHSNTSIDASDGDFHAATSLGQLPSFATGRLYCAMVLLGAMVNSGCSTKQPTTPTDAPTTTTTAQPSTPPAAPTPPAEPAEVEIDGSTLQSAALSPEQLDAGWVRLFDNQSLYGWFAAGKADWQVKDGAINVTRGETSFLCTSLQINDFELLIDFKCDASTNSGIFLRTGPMPSDVSTECIELNIAPTDNPFPTGSAVERMRIEPGVLEPLDANAWHTYRIRLVGNQLDVELDGKKTLSFEDSLISETGHISLQHNSGAISFRNILLRPLHFNALATNDDWEDDWEVQTKDDAALTVTPEPNGLRLKGGLGQLQTKADFGDFFLHAKYTLANRDVNSGIFFRCIRDAMLDGYECQVNHSIVDDNPLLPGDGGAGAIFRRADARIVMGDGSTTTHISLLASGKQISTWVNGVQTVDFQDSREENENPRRGSRTAAGPVSIQGHDPSTEAVYERIEISPLSAPEN